MCFVVHKNNGLTMIEGIRVVCSNSLVELGLLNLIENS